MGNSRTEGQRRATHRVASRWRWWQIRAGGTGVRKAGATRHRHAATATATRHRHAATATATATRPPPRADGRVPSLITFDPGGPFRQPGFISLSLETYLMTRSLAISYLCLTFAATAAAADAPLFPDANLEAAVRAHVYGKRDNKEPLTVDDVKNLSVITAKGKAIKDLSGLEKCAALAQLEISGAEVTDLGPIRGLTGIQSLTLNHNRIKDLSPLAGLDHLQYLDLAGNEASDLKPLAKLTALNTLYLSGNRVADISALKDLTRVWSLYLDGNQIADIAPLARLKNLSTLDLKQNRVKDVSPLAGLNSLKYLFLEGNPLTDLGPLVAAAKKDAEGEKRFAPFCMLYLSAGQGSAAQIAELKKYMHTVTVAAKGEGKPAPRKK
jgi:internalin A